MGIFCDLSKAFDLVDHAILLEKLEFYGIRGTAQQWFKTYLSNRLQRVEISGKQGYAISQWETVKTGVPQGSVLGPLLFLIYINDLPRDSEGVCITLFADDTSIVVNEANQGKIKEKINETIDNLNSWFYANKLYLNIEKTNIMQFTKHKLDELDNMEITLNTHTINNVSDLNFLGLIVDGRLNWSEHIKKLENRLSSICFLLRSLREMVDIKIMKMVYYAYFHSIMKYGLEFWGNSSERLNIFLIQKRAIRIITDSKRTVSCRPLFKSLNIKTMYDDYILSILKLVKQNEVYYQKNEDIHNYATRQSYKLRIKQHSSTFYATGAYNSGLCLYNKLPKHIALEKDLQKFVKEIRELFDKKYFYNIGEIYNFLSQLS